MYRTVDEHLEAPYEEVHKKIMGIAPTGVPRDEHHKKINAYAEEAFKDHVHKLIGPGHWHLAKPHSSHYWTDIAIMGGCGLVLWGDIELCAFAYYAPPNPKKATTDSRALIRWMAEADISYYGRQKAAIAMGHDLDISYDKDVAKHDLIDRYLQALEEDYAEGHSKFERVTQPFKHRLAAATLTALQRLELDEVQDVCSVHYSNIQNLEIDSDSWEWIGDVGKVTASRVIYALAAVRRLHALLPREEGEERA